MPAIPLYAHVAKAAFVNLLHLETTKEKMPGAPNAKAWNVTGYCGFILNKKQTSIKDP